MNTYPATLLLRSSRAARGLGALVASHPRFSVGEPDADGAPAGLVILELDGTKGLDRAASLVRDGRAVEVFVTSTVKDPDVIIQAMRAGINEFLPWPIEPTDLTAALNRFVARREQNPGEAAPRPRGPEGRVIHVLGVKGGVGATTLAVNLAVQARLAAPGRSVALVDAALPVGEIPMFLDLDYDYTWAEAVRDTKRLDATFLESLMVRHGSGVDVLCAPDRVEDANILNPDGVSRCMELLRRMYSLTVVDGSPYLDELSLASVRGADDILLATELSLPGLAVVRRHLESFANLDGGLADKVRLVVTRHPSKGGIDPAEAEDLLGIPVFWKIANDYTATLEAINQGVPMAEAAPKSAVTKAIAGLAEQYVPRESKQRGAGLLTRLLLRRKADGGGAASTALGTTIVSEG